MNEHLGGAHPQGDGSTWMPDVWGYLLVKYNPGILVDIGCGFGHCLKWWGDNLVNCVGIEGWKEAIEKNVFKGTLVEHDFTKGPYTHGIPFDLAWSCEFLEHIEEKFLPNVAPCFVASRYAIITHGEPNQSGHNHVNCRTDSYWVNWFEGLRFRYREDETTLLRRTDRWHAPYGRRTLMFFERL